jgi:MFS family permease
MRWTTWGSTSGTPTSPASCSTSAPDEGSRYALVVVTSSLNDVPIDSARDDAVRRNTVLLAVAQGLTYASAPVLLAVGVVAAAELGDREAAAGLLIAVYFVSAALGAFVAGRWMDRVGRRPGLLVGHVLIGLGGGMAALATAAGSLVGLLGSSVLFGAGAGAALLGRGAVADMYPPKRRGRAVGTMLAASTVGAVGAAPLVAAVQAFAESNGWDRLVLPWLLVPVFEVAALACVAAIRPDPHDLAVTTDEPTGAQRSRRDLLSISPFRAAIVSGAIGQAAMVSMMGVAPIVVHDHGYGDLAVSGVLSAHFLGMFALMPAVGVVLDRWGRKRGLVAAAVVSAIGALAGALGAAAIVTGVGLFLVGLGWAGAYLGSTTVVSDVTARAERASALGLLDLIVSASSAVGALMGGVLLEAGGFSTLTLVVAVLFLPALALVLPLREPEPGRWLRAAAAPA